MKLLELTRSYFPSVGGLEKFVYDRTRIYKGLGIDYKIISTDFSTIKKNDYINADVIYLNQYTPYNFTPSLLKLLNDGYDVISINQVGRFFTDYAIWYFSNKKTKIILTPHLSFHTSRYQLIKYLWNHTAIKYLINKIDVLICFTKYEAEFWSNNFAVKPETIWIIPHYIDFTDHQSFNDGKYFLYIGNYEKNKRIDLLVDAFIELNQNEYSLFLTLDKSMIPENLFNKIKLVPGIKLTGYISAKVKNELLANCSALVFPSDYEAFGIVNLEASIFGKPILCSSIEVFKEILNKDGVIFFENDKTSLKKNLEKFIKLSNNERQNMGSINRKNVERYSYHNAFSSYKKLFAGLNNEA